MKVKTAVLFLFRTPKHFLLIFFLLFNSVFASSSEWTVLVFVQANNNLKNFAQRNFADMASIGSGENLNILMQCYFPQISGTSRYKIEKGKMVLDAHISSSSDGTNSKDLVDAMRWAVTKYPAKKYALVLWNHGVGILDPIWGNKAAYSTSQKFYIEPALLDASPRIQIDDLTMDASSTSTSTLVPIDYDLTSSIEIEKLLKYAERQEFGEARLDEYLIRGILFNEQSRSYMTNSAFISALQEIKASLLKNNKIDVLGMDACLMAMVEVGYQSRNYANFLVASEEAELAHGWDYAALCGILSTQNCTPAQAAQSIVLAYELFYKNKIQFYTQSAVDLNYMDELKKSLDDVANGVKACRGIDVGLTNQMVKKARGTCLQFSATNYIDLHSYCSDLLCQINGFKNNQTVNNQEFSHLKNSLQNTTKVIERAVIASVSGKQFNHAKGISIYFPRTHLEPSYLQTEFGKNSAWTNFILDNIKNN